MNNEYKLERIFEKIDSTLLKKKIDFSALDDCSINLDSSKKNQIIFYKNHNDEKSLNLLHARLSSANPGLIIFTNRPKIKVKYSFIVVSEKKFLLIQRKILEILFPISRFPKVFAITGTNGKTTTAFLLMQLLEQVGKSAGFVGTTGLYIRNKKVDHDFTTTSPGLIDFWKINQKYNDLKFLCVEASSHALEQERFFGFEFEHVAFTNITRDHLDYHKTFDSYFEAKKKILKYLTESGHCFVLDSEEEIYQKLDDSRCRKVSKMEQDHLPEFFKVEFNKKNLALALAILEASLGDRFNFDFNNLVPPDGRLDLVSFGDGNLGVVDFAHTPDAIENVLSEVKNGYPNHKVRVVFGCGGNRDKKKRELMGEIVSALSDEFIITNDNPRDEEPDLIIEDILIGVLKGSRFQVEMDRKKAIQISVDKMMKDEILLILGKGHEDYQLVKGNKTSFSDKKILIESIKDKKCI
jgi:UDP-N-acetylmuramoyl-L-alanyl-D-glutamate--2,6-diaminopimelate ligase